MAYSHHHGHAGLDGKASRIFAAAWKKAKIRPRTQHEIRNWWSANGPKYDLNNDDDLRRAAINFVSVFGEEAWASTAQAFDYIADNGLEHVPDPPEPTETQDAWLEREIGKMSPDEYLQDPDAQQAMLDIEARRQAREMRADRDNDNDDVGDDEADRMPQEENHMPPVTDSRARVAEIESFMGDRSRYTPEVAKEYAGLVGCKEWSGNAPEQQTHTEARAVWYLPLTDEANSKETDNVE